MTAPLDIARAGTYVPGVRDNASDRRPSTGNPYAAERAERLVFRVRGSDWFAVLDDLEAIGWEAAVVGPPGTGKTRFLAGLATALRAEGMRTHLHRARPVGRSLPRFGTEVDGRSVLLVDDADELSAWERWRILRLGRRIAGLVVASRIRFPRLPELHVTRTSPDLLEDLVADLAPSGPRPGRNAIRRLFLRHGGDLRAALAELRERHEAEAAERRTRLATDGAR